MITKRRGLVVAVVGLVAMVFSATAYADGGESDDRSCAGVYPVVVCWPP